jgi:shikimate kinase
MKKYLIILIGSSGSGKNFIINHIIDLLKIKEYSFISVDQYIENDSNFKKESILSKPNTQEYDNLYFKYRKLYDDICDQSIIQNLSNHQNIIFETTGVNCFDWIFDFNEFKLNKNNYSVFLIFPFSDLDTVIKRIENRFLNKESFRYPFIDNIINNYPKIEYNVISNLQNCYHNNSNIDYFIYYNNNGTVSPKLSMILNCKKDSDDKLEYVDIENINEKYLNFK